MRRKLKYDAVIFIPICSLRLLPREFVLSEHTKVGVRRRYICPTFRLIHPGFFFFLQNFHISHLLFARAIGFVQMQERGTYVSANDMACMKTSFFQRWQRMGAFTFLIIVFDQLCLFANTTFQFVLFSQQPFSLTRCVDVWSLP